MLFFPFWTYLHQEQGLSMPPHLRWSWRCCIFFPTLKARTEKISMLLTLIHRSSCIWYCGQRMPNEKLEQHWRLGRGLNRSSAQHILDGPEEWAARRGRVAMTIMMLPAYSISKMVINLYTRIMARRYPEMRINELCATWLCQDGHELESWCLDAWTRCKRASHASYCCSLMMDRLGDQTEMVNVRWSDWMAVVSGFVWYYFPEFVRR